MTGRQIARLEVPADFASVGAFKSTAALREIYGVSANMIVRWRKESGTPAAVSPQCLPLPIPDEFAATASKMTSREAATHFGRSADLVRRWARQKGISFLQPSVASPVVTRALVGPAHFAYQRDMTLAGQAADWLRRLSPVFRCDSLGRPLADGFFWRRGSAVLTDDQLIERAEDRGWNPRAWRALPTSITTEGASA